MTHHGLNQPLIFFCGMCICYKHLQMHVIVNSIITIYGNTNVTPAVQGCHGNFYIQSEESIFTQL